MRLKKGIVDITSEGEVYILDLFHGKTYKNLKANPKISITAVDEQLYQEHQGRPHIFPASRVKTAHPKYLILVHVENVVDLASLS